MERRHTGGAEALEQRLPEVGILTLWTPACRCRCEQSKHSCQPHTCPRQPSQQLRVGRPPGDLVLGVG